MKSASEIITASHQQELKSALDTCTSIATIVGPSDTLSPSEQVAAMKQQIKALAAENADLSAAIHHAAAWLPARTSELEIERNLASRIDIALKTPATDAVIAGIRQQAMAEGIELGAKELERIDTVASTRAVAFKLREIISQQLRSGKGAA